MKNRKGKAYKTITALLAVLLMLALGACNITNQTTGVKDGVIEIGKAKLEFGENSVSNSSESTLSVVKKDDTEKQDGLSSMLLELYLDTTCDSPVTVSIPLENTQKPPDDEAQPMLGIGTAITHADQSSSILYSYIPAKLEDGVVSASFIPAQYMEPFSVNGASGAVTQYGESLRLGIFWCSVSLKEGGHFLVNFPAQAWTTFIDYKDRRLLLNDLEEVYDYYLAKNYIYAKRSEWPMTVNIQTMDDMGYYSYGRNHAEGKIAINRNLFVGGYKAGAIKPLLTHEFFHFVQGNYVGAGGELIWFDEATATYFEGVVAGKIPSIVAEYKEKIFMGVFPLENDSANGYARMPLIKFIADALGESFILNAYASAAAGTDWNSALVSSIAPPLNWAANFYEALVKGDVGDYSPLMLHTSLAGGQMTEAGTFISLKVPSQTEIADMIADGETPLLGSKTLKIAPFGAQLVALVADENAIWKLGKLADDQDPTVSVDGGDLRIFAIRGREVKVFGGGMLQNFKKELEEGTLYLVLVTGLHTTGVLEHKVSVEFARFPTLDELVGEYPDGKMKITKVNIVEDFQPEDVEGCDMDILQVLKGSEGKTGPYPIEIAKTGENTGTLTNIDEDGKTGELMPFTYTSGKLNVSYVNDDGYIVMGTIAATYGPIENVVLDGELWISLSALNEVSLDTHLIGSKPLE